jgi:hypothetical protein
MKWEMQATGEWGERTIAKKKNFWEIGDCEIG